MTDLSDIESNLASTLNAISALKKVYDHEPRSITLLPAASLFFDGFTQTDETMRKKRVTWRWTLRLYVTLQDAEKAQSDLKSLVVSVLDAIRNNRDLGGSCLFAQVASGDTYVAVGTNNPHLLQELRVEAITFESY